MFFKWLRKQYLYMTYIILFLLIILLNIFLSKTPILLLVIAFMLKLFLKIYNDWTKIKDRHEKIYNKKK